MSYFGVRVASGGGGSGVSTADVDIRIRTVSPTLSEEEQAPDAIEDVAPTTAHANGKKVTKILSDGTTEYWKSDGSTWTKTATAKGGGSGGSVATHTDIPAGAVKDSVWLARDTGDLATILSDGSSLVIGRVGTADLKAITPVTNVSEMTSVGLYQIGDDLYVKYNTNKPPTLWEQE